MPFFSWAAVSVATVAIWWLAAQATPLPGKLQGGVETAAARGERAGRLGGP